jgi:hypothetical protein
MLPQLHADAWPSTFSDPPGTSAYWRGCTGRYRPLPAAAHRIASIEVKDRGRVPAEVAEQYKTAAGTQRPQRCPPNRGQAGKCGYRAVRRAATASKKSQPSVSLTAGSPGCQPLASASSSSSRTVPGSCKFSQPLSALPTTPPAP